VEWIGLSFVRSAEDIIELKRIIARSGNAARVIAKIEKPEAIDNIDEIIEVTDGVMVARGDLGVEMPMEQVPLLQKMIARKCRAASKPVIVATQMLESMITSPRPTRAEVNDVANSVLDGADAVMLSGETSVGEYPLIVIETMQKIVRNVEENDYPYSTAKVLNKNSPTYMGDAVCGSAVFLAESTGAVGIISMTSSGYTAFEISSYRPKAATFIFTSNIKLLNTLSLLWGVRGFYYDRFESTDKTFRDVNQILKSENLVETGNVVINTAAIPIEKKGKTNMIKVSIID
jgi:pyruvate kinase